MNSFIFKNKKGKIGFVTYSITAPQLLQYVESNSFADPHVSQYFAFTGFPLALGGGLGGGGGAVGLGGCWYGALVAAGVGAGGGACLAGASSHSNNGQPLSSLNDPDRINIRSINTPKPNIPPVNR